MEEKIKTASEWQGGDLYSGIDSYEKIKLEAGTELYALIAYNKAGKMNTCEYFFPKNELEMAGKGTLGDFTSGDISDVVLSRNHPCFFLFIQLSMPSPISSSLRLCSSASTSSSSIPSKTLPTTSPLFHSRE